MTKRQKKSIFKKAPKKGFFKREKKLKNMEKFKQFLKETKLELKHVVWPSRNQTFYYTLIVIVLSLVVAYLLGAFDTLFGLGLQKVL